MKTRNSVSIRKPIIVRDKNTDLREEIDDYIDSLKEGRGEPPTHVRDIICGVEKKERAEESLPPDEALDRKLAETAGEDQRILLVKPANFEQLEIAREIRQTPRLWSRVLPALVNAHHCESPHDFPRRG